MKSHDAMNYLYGEFFTHYTFTCSKKKYIFNPSDYVCFNMLAEGNLKFAFSVYF